MAYPEKRRVNMEIADDVHWEYIRNNNRLERARLTCIMINDQNFDNAQISQSSGGCWRGHSRNLCSITSNTSEFDGVLQALHWDLKRSCRKTRLNISWLAEPAHSQNRSHRYFILLSGHLGQSGIFQAQHRRSSVAWFNGQYPQDSTLSLYSLTANHSCLFAFERLSWSGLSVSSVTHLSRQTRNYWL
jgi:hypothetical protein